MIVASLIIIPGVQLVSNFVDIIHNKLGLLTKKSATRHHSDISTKLHGLVRILKFYMYQG